MIQFKESENTAVFTTRFVIHDKVTITSVFHYEDGSWQFSGRENNLKDSDYMVVSLGEILSRDSSIKELASMPIGFYATRSGKKVTWEIMPLGNS
jgi:hypothetical protein